MTVIAPWIDPAAAGLKVTVKVHAPRAGTTVLLAQGLPPLGATENCPLAVMLEMVRAEVR